MDRVIALLVMGAACAAAPVAAQWMGMPVWNRPGGQVGLGLSADYGRPNGDAGRGNAFGARASLGIGTVTVGAGAAAWKPDSTQGGGADWVSSVGATAAIRLIGGSLRPFAVNFQVGAGPTARASSVVGTRPAATIVTVSCGVSTVLPLPGFRVEAYASPGLRRYGVSGADDETAFGWVLGAELDLGRLGFHVAYDAEEGSGILGVGAHIGFRPF
jgi:hypothetical protein